MNLQDEFFYKQVQNDYQFKMKLKRNQQTIQNLFFTCTCSTILGTSYTLMNYPLTCTVIYPTISYMTFLYVLKESIKRSQIKRQYLQHQYVLKMKRIG